MRQKILLAFILFFLTSSGYLLVYRGHPLSIDEFNVFDSVESLVNRGEFSRSIQFHRIEEAVSYQPPQLIPSYEPLQIITVAPFYWLAMQSKDLGNFHTALLANIVITALTSVSIYLILIKLRYSVRTAFISALIFAFVTIAVQYSRFLFREPITGLLTLWAFYFALDIGRSERFKFSSLMGLAVSVIGMLLAKQFSIMFLPGIFICITLSRMSLRKVAPYLILFIAIIALFFLSIAIIDPQIGDDRYSFQRWLNPSLWGWEYMWESFLGYQISPSRSFWFYSPILLLSFWGAKLLFDRRKYALVIASFTTLILTSAIYGALRFGSFWDGGWGWGPRYLLPLVPLFILMIAPVIERFSEMSFVKKSFITGIFALSVFIQLLGLNLSYLDFYVETEATNPEVTLESWSPDNWQWESSQLNYHLQNLDFSQWDVAWQYSNQPTRFPALFIALIVVAIAFTVYGFRAKNPPNLVIIIIAIICIVSPIIITADGLRTMRTDARYVDWRRDTLRLIRNMNTQAIPDDIVLIQEDDLNTMLQFMNTFNSGSHYITLPDDLAIQLQVLEWASDTSDRVWLATTTRHSPSPDLHGVSPLEKYMNETLFEVSEIDASPLAYSRLFTFPQDNQTMQEIIPEVYDSELQLVSVKISSQPHYKGGDFLRVVFDWQITEETDTDYHINLHVLDRNGQVVVERNIPLKNETGQTSSWMVDTLYNDRQALELPQELPDGAYQLNVTIYDLLGQNRYKNIATIPISIIEIKQEE